MYEILNTINSPEDVKKLKLTQLKQLATDIREALFNRLTKVGGHCAPNFGIVECEIAMHYVFSSPKDKFVFDVSHQSYPHKMLTGRRLGYTDDSQFSSDSGYTNPNESEHDLFNIGHTSTSISLATGLAKARELKGTKENVVALIGDGSLSGGEALEGLNVAGSEIKSNLIIIVNDNQQSISETHGGIYQNLKKLRKTHGKCKDNIFKSFNLDYIYEEKGNDIDALIKVFKKVKDIDHPIVVHINTVKGKGFKLAEENKEAWHWTMPFDRVTGKSKFPFTGESYVSIAHDFIMGKAKADKNFVVVTPNMPSSFGFKPNDRQKLGAQFVDVGIAEEQAVAMASGLAKAGITPVVVTNTTFIQRAFDQIHQDVCINNSPVTILLNYSSFAGLTDVTHLGIFGISMLSNIPNLITLAPTCKSELLAMLDWSTTQKAHPVVILLPGGGVEDRVVDTDFDNQKFVVEQKGKNVAIIALGDFYKLGQDLSKEIKKQLGFKPTLIDPRFASSVDVDLIKKLEKNHKLVITLEDGIVAGGFGEKVASAMGTSNMFVKNYGLAKEFYDRYNPTELLKQLGMTPEQIVEEIKDILK